MHKMTSLDRDHLGILISLPQTVQGDAQAELGTQGTASCTPTSTKSHFAIPGWCSLDEKQFSMNVTSTTFLTSSSGLGWAAFNSGTDLRPCVRTVDGDPVCLHVPKVRQGTQASLDPLSSLNPSPAKGSDFSVQGSAHGPQLSWFRLCKEDSNGFPTRKDTVRVSYVSTVVKLKQREVQQQEGPEIFRRCRFTSEARKVS